MYIDTEYMYEYLRGLDTRVAAMSDATLLNKINYGLANLASQVQCFFTEETIDVEPYWDAGLYKFTYTPPVEIFDYYKIDILAKSDDKPIVTNGLSIEKQVDKSLMVEILDPTNCGNILLNVGYFYVPVLADGDSLTVESEVWHFFKHAVQIVVWGGLKDYEKEQYHQGVLDNHVKNKMLSYPATMPSQLKGGFL